MGDDQIKKLINSQEPLAIVKYFEWPVFSKSYASAKYVLLRINSIYKDIYEIEVPNDTISFLLSNLNQFEEVFRDDGGVVWERLAFQDKVKELISKPKINQFINQG